MFMDNDILTHKYELTVDDLMRISDNCRLCG